MVSNTFAMQYLRANIQKNGLFSEYLQKKHKRFSLCGDKLRLVVVMPDEQTNADEGQEKLEGYDENVNHNG
jgi:translation elongation factor EF-1beta